jgi:DNA-binding Xre family transcriptional regulator
MLAITGLLSKSGRPEEVPKHFVQPRFHYGGKSAIVRLMSASENGGKSDITSSQIRAARALLGWSREQLSEQCGVPVRTLDRLELGEGIPQRRTIDAVCAALEAAGVEFVTGDALGVCLRPGRSTVE